MIIKGKSVSGAEALANYLQSTEVNERAEVVEIRGTLAKDPEGALIEMDALAMGTRCEKSLYHAKINPEPPHRLTPEQRREAVDALEEKLGLVGHARLIVVHEKLGREHIHVVWSRIDLDHMKAVPDSHNYRNHEEVARDLERRFGHERVQGAHAERDGVPRPERSPSRAEVRQSERTGIPIWLVREQVTEAFRASDTPEAFRAALEEKGYNLAKGDRRDFVIVDWEAGIHSLARRIEGINTPELREFMRGIDRDALPGAIEAREIALERIRRQEATHEEAKIESRYGRSEDYVTQTKAALMDHIHRQKKLDETPRPYRPEELADEDHIARVLEDSDRSRRSAAQEVTARGGRNLSRDIEAKFDNIEMTETQRQRLQRLLDGGGEFEPTHEGDADRQHEASSGGHSRSR